MPGVETKQFSPCDRIPHLKPRPGSIARIPSQKFAFHRINRLGGIIFFLEPIRRRIHQSVSRCKTIAEYLCCRQVSSCCTEEPVFVPISAIFPCTSNHVQPRNHVFISLFAVSHLLSFRMCEEGRIEVDTYTCLVCPFDPVLKFPYDLGPIGEILLQALHTLHEG